MTKSKRHLTITQRLIGGRFEYSQTINGVEFPLLSGYAAILLRQGAKLVTDNRVS